MKRNLRMKKLRVGAPRKSLEGGRVFSKRVFQVLKFKLFEIASREGDRKENSL